MPLRCACRESANILDLLEPRRRVEDFYRFGCIERLARFRNEYTVTYRVCLFHSFDPRGAKVGGFETYMRDFITFHPGDFSLLVIGVDSFGDLELGKTVTLSLRGRMFSFLPILRFPENDITEAATDCRNRLRFVSSWQYCGTSARSDAR